jgi:hypothetical protein
MRRFFDFASRNDPVLRWNISAVLLCFNGTQGYFNRKFFTIFRRAYSWTPPRLLSGDLK